LEKPRILDMFSGIGGFSLGLERAGMTTVRFIEQNKFCQAVLAKHWPEIPCDEDVITAEFAAGEADIIVGGFPCQDVSRAGKRAGITGERSGLYRELVRAIRVVRPQHAILENVAALLGDGLDVVLADLAEIGADAEWDIVPACAVGAPHERERIWIVAHANGFDGWSGERGNTQDGKEIGDGIEPSSVADAAYSDHGYGDADEAICTGRHAPEPGTHEASHPYGTRGLQPQGREQNERGRLSNSAAQQSPHASSIGCGRGRTRRPPDSFARVRDEARQNAADPYGARLAFREGFTRDAWEKLTPAERDSFGNVGQQIWPDEPALSGVDDVVPDWMDRTKATGNTLLPLIVELIGQAIMAEST
jgi:DNA-cytosine methyltransferase